MAPPSAPPLTVDSPITADSGSDPDHLPETQSLSASIIDYPTHWGRRYHKYRDGAYPFPNDSPEIERLTDQHRIFNHYFDGRLYWPPLCAQTATQVLDLGTGTGQWAIELSDSELLPKADITGIDLSPIQDQDVPQNVFFEIQDCADLDWCRDEGSIDLIHSRFMAGSLVSYKRVIRTSKKYLKRGTGWLELHEIHPTPQCDDGSMPDDWAFKRWEEHLNEASEDKLDPPRPIRVAERLKGWLEDCGYVDIHEHEYKIPLRGWPRDKRFKDVGKRYARNLIDGLPGFSYKLLGSEGLGWTREQVELEMMEVRKCLEGGQGVHAYLRYFVVYGRRPSTEEERRIWRTNGV